MSGSPTRKDNGRDLYFLGAVAFVVLHKTIGRGLWGMQGGLIFKLLHFYIGKPMGIAASATNNFLPLSIGIEAKLFLFNPAFYTAAFVGYFRVRSLSQIWMGIIPSCVYLIPILLLTIVPNPGMLLGLTYLLALLPIIFPYSLLGAIVGWQAARLNPPVEISAEDNDRI